jgi:enoyl-CoA hydratase/carnithine racemase
VNEVFPKADLERELRTLADQVAQNAPLTIKAIKIAAQELQKPRAQRDETRASQAVEDCYASEDYREGVAAFLAKRPAIFRGR